MATSHNLGFPRIGVKREMKTAVEAYWRGELTPDQLEQAGKSLRECHWRLQAEQGLEWLPVGDFSWYDHVLDASVLLGAVPERFGLIKNEVDVNTYFCMARGQAPNGQEALACEMTKWFDTNYHYLVPEFVENQNFRILSQNLFKAVDEAITQGYKIKPILLGPLSFLWLGKIKGHHFDKLILLKKLIPVYETIFVRLKQQGVEWLQLDEPILTLDLPESWQNAFLKCYKNINFYNLKCILTTFFGSLGDNLHLACQIPTTGLHVDICSAPEQLEMILELLPNDKILSLGVVNGRNIWRTDLKRALQLLNQAKEKVDERLWIGTSCSLLHSPVDLDYEPQLDLDMKSWLAFAKQKIKEVRLLTQALNEGEESIADELMENQTILTARRRSSKVHDVEVAERIAALTPSMENRQSAYVKRAILQKEILNLPVLPMTTIGSFPQTSEIRALRRNVKNGKIDEETYEIKIRQEIAKVVEKQEQLNLDVLVHGEAERNDMVEYFGEKLNGFIFTENGWVQSYGSRCVKPPIIYGDVSRSQPITVQWSQYAQSLTKKPMKGMLTGPVTILAWSFVRDDQPQADTALQIALALRDEALDLERAGIRMIQIDEPAFREKLPLRQKHWQEYLRWAVRCFRIASCGVKDHTQIHTHMCYSEFNDIIQSIAALDADVITLESSRSNMELLKAFETFDYPNEIGPGVYDIHSPRIPSVREISELLNKALQYIPAERLWVNPDCGLKTRNWVEVENALNNMVAATRLIREEILAIA